MTDFTISHYYMCPSLEYHQDNVGGYSQSIFRGEGHCSCPAFKFSKKKTCKHLTIAEHNRCTWHEAYSDEKMVQEGICPKCGREAMVVAVAV